MGDKEANMRKTKQYKQIIERARKLELIQIDEDEDDIMMDLYSADRTFNLRLDDFLAANDFNFAHDFCGIRNSIIREEFPSHDFGFFLPRFTGENRS